jgi:ATP-binding cassette, subfamily F, member 3
MLVFDDVTLLLGRKTILDGACLSVAPGERIGIIGPNGAGKTTLFKLIAGQMEPDRGEISRQKGTRIGYLPQDTVLEGHGTLLDYMRDKAPGRPAIEAEIATCEADLGQVSDDTRLDDSEREAALVDLSATLADLHERLAAFDNDYADHMALRILTGLGFKNGDENRTLDEFSGGWRMRAVLAGLIFMQPDLLLLDEPTNHLDLPSVAWLSSFLKRYRRAFMLISHDRDFLNEQIARVVSFEPEGLRSYSGNYDRYLGLREAEGELLENRAKNLERERQKTLAFVNRFRAQANKARAVQSRVRALEKMEVVETLETHRASTFRFSASPGSSKHMLAVRGLTKSYGDRLVIKPCDLDAQRGERIAITGLNGAGKTTLLKMLAGEMAGDAGQVKLGQGVALGYFAQHHRDALDARLSVYASVVEVAGGKSPTEIRTLLGSLLFNGKDVEKSVGVLSGGERARVALARLLVSPRNLLLMDEPTNHLDLVSCDRLADALKLFDGTLIFVSHNRAFVRTLATRIWDIRNQEVLPYPGSFDEYLDWQGRLMDPDSAGASASNSTSATPPAARVSREEEKERKRRAADQRSQRAKLLAPLEKRLQKLEVEIEAAEKEQTERSRKLEDPSVFGNNSQSAPLLRSWQDGAAKLERLTAQWEEAALALEQAKTRFDEESTA